MYLSHTFMLIGGFVCVTFVSLSLILSLVHFLEHFYIQILSLTECVDLHWGKGLVDQELVGFFGRILQPMNLVL